MAAFQNLTMIDLGFPIDSDSQGEEVPKVATISQESQQRAKCLSTRTKLHKDRNARTHCWRKKSANWLLKGTLLTNSCKRINPVKAT